jgi:hypothetical protein
MVLVVAGTFLTAGCKSLFPRSESTTVSRWQNYNDVETAFGSIAPYYTTVEDLRTLGFHPQATPNVKILTYVDIIQTFMPTPAIRVQDLPDGVRVCLEAKEKSRAYLVQLHDLKDKRHGNLFLDIFGFKRFTHTSGWEFKGLILINGDLAVYKLSSGEPRVSRDDNKVRPLGPLQEIDAPLSRAASLAN